MANKKLYDENGNEVKNKSFYQQWWFWIIVGLVIIAIIGSMSGDDNDTANDSAGVAETTTAEQGESDNTSENSQEQSTEENTTEAEKGGVIEINKALETDSDFDVTLVSIEHVVDDFWDEEKYVVKFDVKNTSDEDLEFQARSVSINDRMVDESLLTMSQEVVAGKSADAILEIEDYSGESKLPPLEGNLEMDLYAFNWDDMDTEYSIPVDVSVD